LEAHVKLELQWVRCVVNAAATARRGQKAPALTVRPSIMCPG
jgi:hypothetical protein